MPRPSKPRGAPPKAHTVTTYQRLDAYLQTATKSLLGNTTGVE